MTLPGPNGFDTTGLRDDARQWIIYGEPQQGALVRALEMACLEMAGRSLVRVGRERNVRQVRALGFLALNLAQTRKNDALKAGGYRLVAMGYMAKILNWLAGTVKEVPIKELDEFHAIAYQLDHRARSAGIQGRGNLRELVRGD